MPTRKDFDIKADMLDCVNPMNTIQSLLLMQSFSEAACKFGLSRDFHSR